MTVHAACHEDQIRCNNTGLCIAGSNYCNGVDNCGDSTDEPDNCDICEHRFRCHNDTNACVPTQWVCDGIDDCADGSDEPSNCSQSYSLFCIGNV